MHSIWKTLREQAEDLAIHNPHLSSYLHERVLSRDSFGAAMAAHLSQSLREKSGSPLAGWFEDIIRSNPQVIEDAATDINHLVIVNPACPDHLTAFLTFRGVQAVQAYRLAHTLWIEGDTQSAVILQNWAANTWSIDIHPAARLGRALFVDHGIGLVIGETAVVEDEVSLWHGVTLGSTLSEAGDRHPKIRRGALICAGATVLGNIEVGARSIVAANAVVLKNVEEGVVVAGTPAKVVGQAPSSLATFTSKSNN